MQADTHGRGKVSSQPMGYKLNKTTGLTHASYLFQLFKIGVHELAVMRNKRFILSYAMKDPNPVCKTSHHLNCSPSFLVPRYST